MQYFNVKRLFKNGATGNIIIPIASIILIYIFISLYFANHFFFNTTLNGVDVSLRLHNDVDEIIRSYIKEYKLKLIERDGEIEAIVGQDIDLKYNKKSSLYKIYTMKRALKWGGSILKPQRYYVNDLYIYDRAKLGNKIKELSCLNKNIIEPQNVSFKYSMGTYEVIEEVYGNRIFTDKLNDAIESSILEGKTSLDLNDNLCYKNPKYTLSSSKTAETKNLLDKHISTKITYIFGSESEVLDGNTINGWLSVDENLDVVIDKQAVKEYVKGLCKKYDTVGRTRKIRTSTNKTLEVKGGIYGWKINYIAETAALLENIKNGEVLQKEPIYIQKAVSRGENDIGNTYVEISITKQYLWFYKDGKLVARGAVVTGNPNKGYSTKTGVYMLNYKEQGSILRGQDYEAEVTYWMPFYGNIGIHDASWRYSFGGEIYKRNGSHGCVNAPLYLAKRIYNNIEEGTPIICYEE